MAATFSPPAPLESAWVRLFAAARARVLALSVVFAASVWAQPGARVKPVCLGFFWRRDVAMVLDERSRAEALTTLWNVLHIWYAAYFSRPLLFESLAWVNRPYEEVSMFGNPIFRGDFVTVVATGEVVQVDYFYGTPNYLQGGPLDGQRWFQVLTAIDDEPVFPGTDCATQLEVAAASQMQRFWRSSARRRSTPRHVVRMLRAVERHCRNLGRPERDQ